MSHIQPIDTFEPGWN